MVTEPRVGFVQAPLVANVEHVICSNDRARRDAELRFLCEKVLHSCRVSFARLYDLTSPSLLGLILSINPDRTQAELSIEETFVQAWMHRSQLDLEDGVRWLAAIARNVAMAADEGAGFERFRKPTRRDVFLAPMNKIVP